MFIRIKPEVHVLNVDYGPDIDPEDRFVTEVYTNGVEKKDHHLLPEEFYGDLTGTMIYLDGLAKFNKELAASAYANMYYVIECSCQDDFWAAEHDDDHIHDQTIEKFDEWEVEFRKRVGIDR